MESALDVNSGATALAALLDPPQAEEVKEETEAEPEATVEEPAEPEAETESEETPEEDGTVTIEIDGKPVTLTKEQLADAYKSGLRQSDYTKKTMEVAEQRKAAEAEIQKAQQERQVYAQKLAQQEAVLGAALQEQNQIDWARLLESDPVEYLKQQHLYQQRQVAYQNAKQEQAQLQQQAQAEQQKYLQRFLSEQQEELLAKLPEWKDETKAKAEKQALREYLLNNGYSEEQIGNIHHSRDVVTTLKAMRYDEMMSKAKAAAKKVENLPQKVIKSGSGEKPANDKGKAAFNRLSRSGKVEDAAAVFATLL